MSDLRDNRVRPIVRLLSGVFGVAFALFGIAGIALLGATIWGDVRTGHVSVKPLLVGIVVPLGAYSIGSIFLITAWTGQNPQVLDDETPGHDAPAV